MENKVSFGCVGIGDSEVVLKRKVSFVWSSKAARGDQNITNLCWEQQSCETPLILSITREQLRCDKEKGIFGCGAAKLREEEGITKLEQLKLR